MDKIKIPYRRGEVIFDIYSDLTILDENRIEDQIAKNPNIRFRYMWHYVKVQKYLSEIKQRFDNFIKGVCYYWGRFILVSEGYDIRKITNTNIDTIVRRAWSNKTLSDEDELEEYVDKAIHGKYQIASPSKKMNRDAIFDEMYPEIIEDDEVIWFRGFETESEHIIKWEETLSLMDMCVKALGDKGYALSSIKDLMIEGIVDLRAANSKLKSKVNI